MLERPGGTLDWNGKQLKYPDVKLVYWVGGNPFVHHQERKRLIAAWRKLETVIVHDSQWTPTARFADIVLPATTTFERDDIEQVGDYSLRYIIALKKAVEPVGEARDDYEIFRAIAAKFGKEREFTEGKSQLDWIRGFYEDARKQAQQKKVDMPAFEAFWNGPGFVEFPVSKEAQEFVRYGAFRKDPLLEPLGTPSGKIEIFSRNIEKMAYDDCPPHPTWMEPFERTGRSDSKYPLHVATSHPQFRLHSQLNGTVLRKEYNVAGREPCLINPQDAQARGIANGDVVRVFNDRGELLAGAVVTDSVRPGVIRINEGGWYDPVDASQPGSLCKYGDVNALSSDRPTSKLGQGNCGHSIIGQVEKYTGPAQTVTAFDGPRTA